MRILILSQFFHPELFLKGLPFAQELQRRGHEVEVLTGFPNYPGGRIYPGYRNRLRQTGQMEGITVHRVVLYPSHDRSGLRRFANYCSFALSAALLGPLSIRKPDVIYAYHPPITVGAVAAWLSLLTSAPVVYDVQDLWPDTVVATGMMRSPMALRILKLFCSAIYRSMDRVAVLSPGFRDALVSLGVSASRIDVIYNWTDESSPEAAPGSSGLSENLKRIDGFKVLFAGTMGLAQDLDTVLDAARICLEEKSSVHFILLGSGIETDRLKQRAGTLGLDENLHFVPRIPPNQMPDVLEAADALLVHLRDQALFEITIPSKTQTYLAAGKPIIMAVNGDAAALVRRAGSGIYCAPGNARALADAVRKMAGLPLAEREQMGIRGRRFYQQELSLASGVSKFEAVFEAALQNRKSAKMKSAKMKRAKMKRALDLTLSALTLVFLSPLLAACALAIWLTLGSPVLFRQTRPGYQGRLFTAIKFRTMLPADPARGLITDHDRLTKLGRFLRATSLDELPQLWNVLLGEMSLVGPRPLLPQYLERYSDHQKRRHDVKPGITGWAQVHGRNTLTWEQKFDLDIWYVEHRSLPLDLKILYLTVLKVLQRDGISQHGHATMPEFIGPASLDHPRK